MFQSSSIYFLPSIFFFFYFSVSYRLFYFYGSLSNSLPLSNCTFKHSGLSTAAHGPWLILPIRNRKIDRFSVKRDRDIPRRSHPRRTQLRFGQEKSNAHTPPQPPPPPRPFVRQHDPSTSGPLPGKSFLGGREYDR